jgi:hypothetical protein
MNLALLAPFGLVALAALALPLLIHLVRRLELTTTPFPALRWIAERVRPQRRLRVERPWLLLLRLLLLALLAVLLARPVWDGGVPASRPWAVVAPGVDLSAARAAAGDLDAQWHWLAPGFPRTDEAAPSAAAPVASLLRELDAQLPSGQVLAAIVPARLDGLDGERPQLSRKVDWRVVPGQAPSPSPPSPAPIRLAVRYAPEAESSLRYLRAAVAAWNQREADRYVLDAQPADAPLDDASNWLVWLAPRSPALERWLERGGTALVAEAGDGGEPLWRDAAGRVLARSASVGRGRAIGLSGALTPAALPLLLDADFPDRLRAALDGPPLAPTRATAAAAQPRHDAQVHGAWLRSTANARPLDPWLAALVAVLFLLERLVATRAARPADRNAVASASGATRREPSP